MADKKAEKVKKPTNEEILSSSKKLSKIGEWLKSGKSLGTIVDMKAVLK